MGKSKATDLPGIHRRRFISNTIKLAVLGTIISPIEACSGKKNKHTDHTGADTSFKGNKSKPNTNKKNRQKWSHESLVVNTKTGVMHFPTSKLYHYYDEIKAKHLQQVAIAAWASQLEGRIHLHKHQSGNILELLALQQLKEGVNDQSLNSAINTLSTAFSSSVNNTSGVNLNETNFRLHELMLQLVSLNTAIPPESKWQTFNSKVKKPASLRKRQQWMSSENAFNDRVKYIAARQSEFMNRLTERAKRYSFT